MLPMSQLLPDPPLGVDRRADGRTPRQRPAALTLSTRFPAALALLTVFWVYVTATNILWGASMRESLVSIGGTHVFAPWDARLVQHLLLYLALVGCMWISRRIGWQPLWKALPLQVMCALIFSALGNPSMDVAEVVVGMYSWHDILIPGTWMVRDDYPGRQEFLWVASAVSVLIDYAFCLALLAGFEFYRRYRDSQLRAESLERSLSAAQLATLRMQLSPHTLFNLLHTIRGHVTWDPDVAQAMIIQLSDLLRRALQAGEQELSRLQDELDFVKLYLELQQRRFSDRLVIVVPCPQESPPVWVPSLILQPLVENAVLHGLAQEQTAVSVRVEVEADGEVLILRVVNTWRPGGGASALEQTGIGLKNVRERLAIQFNGRAAFRSEPAGDGDWVAEMRFPMLHNGA